MNEQLPPPPPGFVMDGAAAPVIPAPPPGFAMDAQAPAAEPGMWDRVMGDLHGLVAKDAATIEQHGVGQLALDAGQSVPAGAVKGTGSILSGAGELYDLTGRALRRGVDAVLPESVSSALDIQIPAGLNPGQWLRGPGDIIQQGGEAISVPEERRGLTTMGAEGIGQLVPQVAAGVAAPVLAPASLMSQGVDQMADTAHAAGTYGTASSDTGELLGGMATGVSEKIGLDFLMNRLPPALKGKFINRLADMGIAGIGEAGSEVAEQGAQNLATQQFIDPSQKLDDGLGVSGAAGGATGATARLLLSMLGVGGAGRVRPQSNPGAQEEIDASTRASDDEIISVLRSMGMTDEQIHGAQNGESVEGLSGGSPAEKAAIIERRRAEDAARAPATNNDADGGKKEFKRFQKELDRQAAERSGLETGDVHPAAVAQQPQRTLPEVMPVAPSGQAIIPDAGTQAGQQLRSGQPNANALVPVDPNAALRRGEMTPDEVATAQRHMNATGTPNAAPDPGNLTVPENRAAQTVDQRNQDREAGDAFAVADRQRGRVGPEVLDTEAAGRPQGADAQPVYLDDDFPVQVMERTWVEHNGKGFEAAKVQRFDPRTGQPDPESEPYLVPVKQLKKKNYAVDPRQAQDVVDRSQGPITPEKPRAAGLGNPDREPEQTYRATEPDANTEFPAAGEGRSPLPAQPEGRGPWRERSTREDDYIRDFEDRQRRQQRSGKSGQQSQNDYGGKEWGGKFSNQAEAPGADSRYATDDAGHVTSNKGGPMKFGDQKQAAKWILNVGHKTSPDQFFEIANHPSGKGFTVREAGRTSGGPQGGASGTTSEASPTSAKPVQAAPRGLPAPSQAKAEAGETAFHDEPEPQSLGAAARRPGKVKQPDTLLARIRRWGGMKNDSGDFADLARQFPGFINNGRDGMNIDTLGDRLLQEGYEVASDTDRSKSDSQKTEALIADMKAGKPVYSPADAIQAADYDAQEAAGEAAGNKDEEANRADLQEAGQRILGRDLSDDEIERVRGRMFGNPPSDLDTAFTDALEWEIMGAAFADAGDINALDDMPFDMPEETNAEGATTNDNGTVDSQRAGAPKEPEVETGRTQKADAEPSRSSGDQEAQSSEVKTEKTDQGDQVVMPGMEQSARQKRDANRAKNRDVKDGLFADREDTTDEPPEKSFWEDDRGSLDLDAVYNALKAAGAGINRAIFDGPLGKLISATFIDADDVREFGHTIAGLAKAIGEGAITKSMKTSDGQYLIARFARMWYQSDNGYMRGIARRMKSPTLTKIINMISVPGGDTTGAKQTFDEEMRARTNKREGTLQKILDPIMGDKDLSNADRKAMMEAVVRQVRNPRSINPATRIGKVAKAVQGYLKEELAYLKAAGVDIGEVKDGYFPRELDQQAVMLDQDKFLRAATKLYQDDQGMNAKDADASARSWLENILYGGVGRPGAASNGFGSPKFTKGRVFSKLMETRLDGFLLKDPDNMLSSYSRRAAKRAAIASRFGDNWSGWDKMAADIIKEGAGGALPELTEHLAMTTGGGNVGNTMVLNRKLWSMIRTWTTLGLLEKAVLSSLGEPFIAAARTGNVMDGLHGAALTAKEFFRTKGMSKTALREYAEDIGAIAGTFNHAVMAARFGSEDTVGQAQQKLLAAYFARTKLEALTNASIVAQTGIAHVFMRRLSNDVANKGATEKSSRAFLRELGIPDDKIDGFAKAIKALGSDLPTMANMKGEMGDLARAAANRFQQQVIQQPTAASRPRWSNGGGLGSVAFQLASWTYSFSRNILARTARLGYQALTDKDLAAVDRARLLLGTLPGLALTGVIQYGLGELRDEMEDEISALTSPDGKSTRKTLTPEAKVERAASRAGFFGVFDPLIQLYSQTRYGRDAAAAVAGPGISRLTSAINVGAAMFSDRNSDKTNTAERKLAGAFYDMAIEPLANVLLAPLSRSPVGTMLTVAVVPGLKEAFVTQAAGAQDRKSLKKSRKDPIHGLLENAFGD